MSVDLRTQPAFPIDLRRCCAITAAGSPACGPEEASNRSHDLLRTLVVKPPVRNGRGRVRVAEIDGFDAQACGGSHVRNTTGVSVFRIERAENKGKINKRLYVRLDPPRVE